MKKLSATLAMLLAAAALHAELHPIAPHPGTTRPMTFYASGQGADGVSCTPDGQGGHKLTMDARKAPAKLVSNCRIKLAEGDQFTLRLTLQIRTPGTIAAGFYLYDLKDRFLGAAYRPTLELRTDVRQYEFTDTVPGNPKEKSAFERPSMGLVFFDAHQGVDFDILRIEYVFKRKPAQESYELPEI